MIKSVHIINESTGSYLLVEGPLQQSITQSSHHHKEKRQVTATPCPVPIQVDPQTHLIAVFTGVEGCWGKTDIFFSHIYWCRRLKNCDLNIIMETQ